MAATTNRDWRKADDGPDGNMAMGPWDHEPKRGPHGDAISRWSREEKEQGLIHSMPPLSAWTRRCCAAHGQIWQCLRRKLMSWMKAGVGCTLPFPGRLMPSMPVDVRGQPHRQIKPCGPEPGDYHQRQPSGLAWSNVLSLLMMRARIDTRRIEGRPSSSCLSAVGVGRGAGEDARMHVSFWYSVRARRRSFLWCHRAFPV